ncbi:hypothetical protein EJ02DRAFT_473972 [Clathrospora elynae]|uniref:RING-type domain-containing protein n=1 Tax=Clathrospora elynae TaxID=706981 RepID=A0A6A5SFF9_9PLEO|nr:hypothetical protein EJ02DRAFT_473972 [Clathrospora elynae]
MPRRTERRLRQWLARLIPIPLENVAEDDRTCTLCYEPFPNLEDGPDYPVRVRSMQPNSACRHIFGRQCIEDHLSSSRSYSRRCPVCRERWFDRDEEYPSDDHLPAAGLPEDDLQDADLPTPDWVGEVFHRSRERTDQVAAVRHRHVAAFDEPDPLLLAPHARVNIAPEVTPIRVVEGARGNLVINRVVERAHVEGNHASHEPGTVFPSAGRITRIVGFLERILASEELQNGSSEISQSVTETERAVERLWRNVDDSQRRRRQARHRPS